MYVESRKTSRSEFASQINSGEQKKGGNVTVYSKHARGWIMFMQKGATACSHRIWICWM